MPPPIRRKEVKDEVSIGTSISSVRVSGCW
jgi:hypothetical protein